MSHPAHPVGPVQIRRFPLVASIPGGVHRRVAVALALDDLPVTVYPDGTDLIVRAEWDARGDKLATLRAQAAWRLGAPTD